MVSIFDTATYILQKTGEISTMKLQKLCYYSQAWSLVWDDEPLFDEDFQAWANGPVCPTLFYKTQGQFSVTSDNLQGDPTALSPAQIETIDSVVEHYGKKDAQWLSTLTHMEKPWQEARGNLPAGVRCNNVITKESMAMYYGGL